MVIHGCRGKSQHSGSTANTVYSLKHYTPGLTRMLYWWVGSSLTTTQTKLHKAPHGAGKKNHFPTDYADIGFVPKIFFADQCSLDVFQVKRAATIPASSNSGVSCVLLDNGAFWK